MTLNSLGVTWLMIWVNTGFVLWVIAVTCDRHVEGFERDIAVALAERRLGLEHVRIDHALDHDLGIRRHVEIDGAAARHADRRAGSAAGDRHLVHVDRKLLRAGEHHDRRAADHDRDRHLLAALAVLQPMQKAAGAGRLARHHPHHRAVGGLQRDADRCPCSARRSPGRVVTQSVAVR